MTTAARLQEPRSLEQCNALLLPLKPQVSCEVQYCRDYQVWHQVLVLCHGETRPRLLGQGSTRLAALRQAAGRVQRFGAVSVANGEW